MTGLTKNVMALKTSICRRSESGMTIPEVIVAVSIFAIVGVTFTNAMSTNYKVLLTAHQRTIAESLSKTQMESINNSPYNSTSPYTYNKITGIPDGYDINIVAVPVNPETGAASALDLGVQKVTVIVTCQQRSPSEVTRIESYKR